MRSIRQRRVLCTLALGLMGLLLVLAMALLFGMTSTHAQDNTDPKMTAALRQAADFLSQKIGKPIPTVDNFTYESITFPDAGLGCPADGKQYAPAPVQGYKFLITFNGMAYDVHTSADGAQIVLCSSAAVKTKIPLATYRSPLFSIPYPDRWNFVDRSTDIFFGESATPVCSQPGMTAIALGQIATGKTPDTLLDEYQQQSNVGIKYDGSRINIGNIGRSTLYNVLCSNGTPRTNRVTTFLAFGRGYRVLQFAPQTDFAQWDETFQQILQGFSPGEAGVGISPSNSSSGISVKPPAQTPLALVAHIFAGNVYTGTLTDLPGTPITTDASSDHAYSNVAVAPDGQHLAFVDPAAHTLYVATPGSRPARKLVDKLAPGYPIAWNPNSQEIGYLTDLGLRDGDRVNYTLMTISTDGSTARKIGDTISLGTGCDKHTTDPAEQQYWIEAGADGNATLLLWARDAVYYSLGCDGVGLGKITLKDGSAQPVHPNLRHAQLSPDGTELLGLAGAISQAPALVRLKLDSQESITLTTSQPPDQVAWSADSHLVFYSTAVAKNTIKLDDPAAQDRGMKAFGVWPFQTTTYDVALHQIDLGSSVDTSLFSSVGRAIGRIVPSPDGSGVLFTFVQGAADLTEAFKSNASVGDLRRSAPNIALFWLPMAGQAQLVALTSGPTWGPLGSGAAPTPTSGPKQPSPTPRLALRLSPTPSPTVTAFVVPTLTPMMATTATPGASGTLPATRSNSLPPPTNTRAPGPTPAG